MTNRQLFLQHVAQTSQSPIGLEIVNAAGCRMWDKDGKEYFDLISGFSVMNIGHSNPTVIEAITQQVSQYMHLMVYGEIIESPQVAYAKTLTEYLPASLDCVYFTNSGSEATEGAMKLAKRFTNRSQIIAFKNSYHGSTQGALSIMGDENWRNAYRPLLPDILHLHYNNFDSLDAITERTACIVMETVQAEAGVICPDPAWIRALREKCTTTGTLLVLDEIQTGFGRTGSLWAFEQYGIVPDILLIGKALGGGLPLGAFISSNAIMQTLTFKPVLGHISTFAGHPVSCAAGLAAFEVLVKSFFLEEITESNPGENETSALTINQKSELILKRLQHPAIKAVRSSGLLMAVEFKDEILCQKISHACVQNGLVTDWFLFAPNCLRVAPPLVISREEIEAVCRLLIATIEQVINGR
ncbi:MAG: aspartate aminotransferase family protein [Bacteroidota bacterium]